MILYYALELLSKPGFFVCTPHHLGPARVLTFSTEEAAETYRWSQDVLVVMGTRVARTAGISAL